jgi:L-threonylcarbamoyladenylate synthase
LIVHVTTEGMLSEVAAEVSEADRSLMQAFWPGPLTLLLPRSEAVPALVTAGRLKVGVRMPAHPVARALIHLAGMPIAAPSANSFGRISPTTAQHVLEDLDGRIDAVIDGGATTLGLESSVVDANTVPPTLYRHGMLSLEDLRRILPELAGFDESRERLDQEPSALPSPGVGIRHYAPRAQLVLIEADDIENALQNSIIAVDGKRVGVLLPEGFELKLPESIVAVRWGRWYHTEELAQGLFAGLRALDNLGVDMIVCPLPAATGVGAALRDRLRKAARKR